MANGNVPFEHSEQHGCLWCRGWEWLEPRPGARALEIERLRLLEAKRNAECA
jgi:hypothetical protein